MKLKDVFLAGILKENPAFVMLLGMCPTLAVTTQAFNGLGMGLATTFVLLCSNVAISLLRKVIPSNVRIPCYITVIAGFVTLVKILMEYFVPSLYSSLGIFLSLIVVNCVIFGRAEVFAGKNPPLPSALDGLGMGLGFTMALVIVGSVREILGSGSIFGLNITGDAPTMMFFVMPAGGFFTLGVLVALVSKLTNKPVRRIDCDSCPNHATCQNAADCSVNSAVKG